MFCRNCGQEISSQSYFCKKCRDPQPKKNKNKWIVVTLFILVLGLGLGIGVYYLPPSTPVIESTPFPIFSGSLANKVKDCDEASTIKRIKWSTHKVYNLNKKGEKVSYGSGIAFQDTETPRSILTNYHIIEGASSIKIWDGFEGRGLVPASIYKQFPDQDIALLKVETPLFAATDLIDSDQVKDAETLYAIGWPNDPNGEATITKGILSRRITEDGFDIIQTDTPINPGNSGGPLINKCGVIGMNTAKMSWSDNDSPTEGIGYALSSNYIKSIINKK